ncbi:RICIN domain-containing protein [Kitasatospora sp. NPDC056783]|uniref:RICIN domain-containing protein n=1 Tax=Kitasatospora sp. NPDC056783 TaxID=3345943 RepID=UPI0036B69ADF
MARTTQPADRPAHRESESTMPHPHRQRSRARRPLNVLGTVAAAGALLFTAAPVALAAPAPTGGLAADPTSNYSCDHRLNRIIPGGDGIKRPLTVALSPGNHGSVIQYKSEDQLNQLWKVCRKRASDGRELVYLQDAWRRWCMAVDHWGLEDGTWIITQGCVDEDVPKNQSFWMAKVAGSNLFALQAQVSGKWVAASGHNNEISQIVQDSKPDLYYLEPA